MLLTGKTALVTGASRGIGRAIAILFASEGALVYANARTVGSLDAVSDEYRERHLTFRPLYFDVCDTAAIRTALMTIKKETGRLDILVNNAGIMSSSLLGMTSKKSAQELFDVNVFAPLELMQMASKLMLHQKSGSIINLSSIVGERGNAGQAAYAASKGAVSALTKSVSHELAPHGIRVNAVAPGYIDTDLFNAEKQEIREQVLSRVKLGRIGTPKDVARVCLFLASDLSDYVSGQIIGVDGDIQ